MLIKFSCVWLVYLPYPSTSEFWCTSIVFSQMMNKTQDCTPARLSSHVTNQFLRLHSKTRFRFQMQTEITWRSRFDSRTNSPGICGKMVPDKFFTITSDLSPQLSFHQCSIFIYLPSTLYSLSKWHRIQINHCSPLLFSLQTQTNWKQSVLP